MFKKIVLVTVFVVFISQCFLYSAFAPTCSATGYHLSVTSKSKLGVRKLYMIGYIVNTSDISIRKAFSIVNKVMYAYKITGLSPFLIMSVIKEESRFNRDAISDVGAVGYMQLEPVVISEYGRGYSKSNILVGSMYLKHLINIFRGSYSQALTAYNMGRTVVQEDNIRYSAYSNDILNRYNILHNRFLDKLNYKVNYWRLN